MKLWGRDPKADEMPFLDHLEELRWRILWSMLAIIVGFGIGFWLVTRFDALGLLIRPIEPFLLGSKIRYLSPSDPFFVTLKLALVVGLLLAFPIIVYQVWTFVSPALMPEEKRAIVPSLYFGLVLFLAGVALCYFAALPLTLRFMMSFQTESLEQSITIGPYMGFVVKMLLAFGLVFELPVVMLVLGVLGVVNTEMLKKGRRYALVIITAAAALITPGDAVALTIFMMVPLVLLYELGIVLVRVVERRRERRMAALRDTGAEPDAETGAPEPAAPAGSVPEGSGPEGPEAPSPEEPS